MSELEIAGIGIWSTSFSNWEGFTDGINNGKWQSGARLQPDMIPARERRRAPQSVKLAVEVMAQACAMAGVSPADAAVVFSSAMGDMDITDYLCRTLALPPRLVSPTRFHNSVHNATTGYWSIAGQCHQSTNAVSAQTYTAPMAFLEAAIQSLEECTPVLLVTQEMQAPTALQHACPSAQPFSAAFMLTPTGYCKSPLSAIRFTASSGTVQWPTLPIDLRSQLDGNPGARFLPLLAAIATESTTEQPALSLKFPLSSNTNLELTLSTR